MADINKSTVVKLNEDEVIQALIEFAQKIQGGDLMISNDSRVEFNVRGLRINTPTARIVST